MTDADTPTRVRAALPRGLVDRDSADIAAAEAMMAKIRDVYRLYGFEAAETPFIEYTDALGKFLPDQDRPNEGVFSFKDDEQWLSLRYDLTAPLARYVAENFDRLPKPYRSFRAGWVFRNEKPGPGRFRQFMQFDADTVGSASPAADAEMCMMAADCLEALGIRRGDYVVKVNNRKVLIGWMEANRIVEPEQQLKVLRAIDTMDRLGIAGVRERMGEGRKDASGDVTEGARLTEEQVSANVAFLTASATFMGKGTLAAVAMIVPGESVQNARDLNDSDESPKLIIETSELGSDREAFDRANENLTYREGMDEVALILTLVRSAGYGEDRIRFDRSVVRGLEYYTGPVFEAELTFETPGDDGKPVRFGSVGGGGRYDGLVARFRAEPVPATGFSIGVSRLLAALRAINSPIVAAADAPGPVVVLALDRDEKSMANYQRIVASLREAGIAAELYLGSGGMNAQLKYADKRGSRCAVIQGSNERGAPGGPQVTIRDLRLGAELAKATKDRADYLELRQRAQFAAPEAELVERVRGVLMKSELFLPGLPADCILAAYHKAPGNEIASGKFASAESSAALVANTFGLFLEKPATLPALPGTENCGWPASSVCLETVVRFPWKGGRHPCLDVLIVTDTCLIGVESKRFEPFRARKKASMSKAYWREVWGDKMKGFESCRDGLRDGTIRFASLDAAQLIKHAFGLRTAVQPKGRWPGKRPILVYIYAEPAHWPGGKPLISAAERAAHRAELDDFASCVSEGEVSFRSCSYATLLESWDASPDREISAHARAIRERFFS